ncbi:uncharacterized protein LOC136061653 [Quercus suber]|uniref:uncharacterized protein LOC136061653 n=1 Tax=Quercus suber TaxID=58331 RepID=UPI0032DFC9AC
MPRTSVKGQVLADLVAKFAETSVEEKVEEQNMDGKSVRVISVQEPLSWKVYVDGAANHRGSGAGLILISPERITIEKSLRLGFSAINKEVEYETLLEGMIMVQKMGGKAVELFSDSRFESFSVSQVPRSKNAHADSLATLATSSAQNLPRVILVEDLCKPTKAGRIVVHVHQTRVGPSWMDAIVLFIKEDFLLEEKSEADKMQKEAQDYAKKCDQCQRFTPNIHQPRGVLNPLSNPWPFAQWGLDIVGPFPKTTRNKRFGVPRTLISDNGLQFDNKAFRRYCYNLGIKNRYSTRAYPQGNGQAEAVNKITPRRSTRETSFSMTYEAEAVIPLKTGFPTRRTSSCPLSSNNELLERSLDLVEERRESVMVQLAYYQHKLKDTMLT